MSVTRAVLLGCVALTLACGPQRVVSPPPAPDLVALLPDADDGTLGRASVSNQYGAVDLEADRAATRILPGAAPSPAVTMSEAEVTATFGEAIAATPMTPQYFVLYFRFESNELTDESRALLPQVLKAVAAYPAPEVVAVGHTDASGDSQTNVALGLSRAQAVRIMLIDVGVDASLVEVASHGEGNPLVPTPDGALEPRNRRVEIAVR